MFPIFQFSPTSIGQQISINKLNGNLYIFISNWYYPAYSYVPVYQYSIYLVKGSLVKQFKLTNATNQHLLIHDNMIYLATNNQTFIINGSNVTEYNFSKISITGLGVDGGFVLVYLSTKSPHT